MPPRRRSLARVAAPLAWWLAAGCQFDPRGVASTTALDLTTASSSSSGEPPGTTAATTTSDASTGDASTGEPGTSSTGDACSDGCAPSPGWTVTVEGVGQALQIDGDGNAIVVGDQAQLSDAGLNDIWVASFAGADGQTRWSRRHTGAEKRNDFARGLALTADGTIVVVGGSQEMKGRRIDVWAGWFDPADGTPLTTNNLGTSQWNGTDADVDEWAQGLAIDRDGDGAGELYVVGRRCMNPCDVPEAWLGRFTAEGKPIWDEAMLYGGQGSLRAAIVAGNELFAVGTDGWVDAMAPWRSVARRFDLSGGGDWSSRLEDSGVSFEAVAAALAGDGRLWVVGREIDPAGPDGGFLRIYSPDIPDMADLPVAERRGDALGGELAAISLAADGTAIVAGAVGDERERHLWLGGFDAALEPVWRIDEPADVVREARGVALDPDGALIVLGHAAPADPDARPLTWLGKYDPPPRG